MIYSAFIPFEIRSGNKTRSNIWVYEGYKKLIQNALGYYLKPKERRITKDDPPPLVKIRRIYIKGRRAYDEENFKQGCKPIFDFLKRAGYLFDDNPKRVIREYYQEPAKGREPGFNLVIQYAD